MSKKILSVLLTVGLISTLLTGCVSFSYGNPVAEKKYAVEMPNGEVYELTEEEAKELLSMQGELQRELGLSDEEMEQLREELYILLGYEEQEVESEEVQTEEFEEPTEEESVEVETSTEEQQTEIETVTEETQE